MGDMLSQEEINALFGTAGAETAEPQKAPETEEAIEAEIAEDEVIAGFGAEEETVAPKAPSDDTGDEFSEYLQGIEKDVLGEIGNISMGTSASTLYTLLGEHHRVDITTPKVKVMRWSEIAKGYDRPCVGIRVNYVVGIEGTSALVMKERDVKIISDLMMGGDGLTDPDGEVTELDLSAIAESMNQMIGSSSTSLATLIKTKIDIDTPTAFLLDFNDDNFFESVKFTGDIVACIAFRMIVGDLIDSEIMQIWPIDFSKRMVDIFMDELMPEAAAKTAAPPQQKQASAVQPEAEQAPSVGRHYQPPQTKAAQQHVNAQPVRFESFDAGLQPPYEKENIDIIMDVPLEITVELGRTTKKIKEILEFAPDYIVELNKLAGETMDILVNGKFVARGEVVVIDENFAVRITDIVSSEYRI